MTEISDAQMEAVSVSYPGLLLLTISSSAWPGTGEINPQIVCNASSRGARQTSNCEPQSAVTHTLFYLVPTVVLTSALMH